MLLSWVKILHTLQSLATAAKSRSSVSATWLVRFWEVTQILFQLSAHSLKITSLRQLPRLDFVVFCGLICWGGGFKLCVCHKFTTQYLNKGRCVAYSKKILNYPLVVLNVVSFSEICHIMFLVSVNRTILCESGDFIQMQATLPALLWGKDIHRLCIQLHFLSKYQ